MFKSLKNWWRCFKIGHLYQRTNLNPYVIKEVFEFHCVRCGKTKNMTISQRIQLTKRR